MEENSFDIEKVIADEDAKDLPRPWERQEYENDRMYGAFRYYANLSPVDRTMKLAYKTFLTTTGKKVPKGKFAAPDTWRNWSYGNDNAGNSIPGALPWVLRARAEDDFKQDEIRRIQIERQAILKQREWDAAEKMFKRAEQMLSFPLARTETIDPGNGQPKQIIIEPVNWKEEDVARTFATASKMARMSVDMPTTQVKFDWRKDVALNGLDPEELLNSVTNEIEKRLEMAGPATS